MPHAHSTLGSIRLVGLTLLVVLVSASPSAHAQGVPIATFLDIDVPAVPVSGDFAIDGERTPDSTGEFAFLVLEDEQGNATPMGASFSHGYGPEWLIPGHYQRRYDFVQSSTGALPQNTQAELGSGFDLAAAATIDFDVPTLDVEFSFLLNGEPFPGQAGEVAWLSLRDHANGETTLIGAGHLSPTTVRIVPGRYDVVYQYGGGDLLPRNEGAIVTRTLDLVADGRVTVDVPSVFAIVAPTLNGAAFPASQYERGALRLVDFESGDVVELGDTNAGSLPVRVIPGTYDVTWERLLGGSLVPMNTNAVVAEAVSIEPPATPNQLLVVPIDVTAHPVDPALTLDGAAFPASQYERGDVVLVGAHGDEVDLGDTSDQTSSTRLVVEGTYDVHYRRVLGGSIVPRNANARIATAVRIDEPMALAIDVTTVEIDLSVHLDGVPFPASQYERGEIHLEGPTPGDRFLVGATHQAPWSVRVIAGEYDAWYDFVTGGGIVPRNPMQRVETDLAFLRSRAETLEIGSRGVIPSFSMNGAPFPTGGFDRGEIVLRGPGGSALSLGETNVASPPSLRVIDSPYAIDYHWIDGDTVPLNVERRIGYAYVPEPTVGLGVAIGAVVGLAGATRRSRSD